MSRIIAARHYLGQAVAVVVVSAAVSACHVGDMGDSVSGAEDVSTVPAQRNATHDGAGSEGELGGESTPADARRAGDGLLAEAVTSRTPLEVGSSATAQDVARPARRATAGAGARTTAQAPESARDPSAASASATESTPTSTGPTGAPRARPSAATSYPSDGQALVSAANKSATQSATQSAGQGDGTERRLVADLGTVTHVWQKWNNCAPASALMALSALGLELDQMDVAAQLKPDREDTNVTPDEIAAYFQSLGFETLVRYGGSRESVRAALVVGAPVVAEQWIEVEGRGEMGHYRVAIGFDDRTGEVIAHDSYYGARRRYGYDEFERMWRPFLGAYVVVYPPERSGIVRAALVNELDEAEVLSRLREEHELRVRVSPDDAWSWFTLGQVRSLQGDHPGAVTAFDRAVAIGLPFRAFWYQFGYFESLLEIGAYDRVVALADETLASMDGENLEESRYWKARALAELGLVDAATAELDVALQFNPRFEAARELLGTLRSGQGG